MRKLLGVQYIAYCIITVPTRPIMANPHEIVAEPIVCARKISSLLDKMVSCA